jgi:hypothetical protein
VQPGEAKDLGDVVVQVSCAIQGHVIDTDGAPAEFGELDLWQAHPDRVHVVWTHGIGTREPGGTFHAQVVAGDYDVYIGGRDIVRGNKVTVPAGATRLDVEVVVAAAAAADTIAGIVTDEAGRPVGSASVHVEHRPGMVGTDAAGRFTLCRPRAVVADMVQIAVQKDGWVSKTADGIRTRWGQHDLHLVLVPEQRCDLELRVVAAADGAPVTDYRVRELLSDRYHEWLAIDRREDGVARLTVRSDRTTSLLVAPDRADLCSALAPVAAAANGHLEVRLPPAAARLLRVQRADGTPAAGIDVEQIHPGNGRLTLATVPATLDTWNETTWEAEALLLQRSPTDARGELRLRGAEDQPIALRLPGPGHAPLLVQDVALGVAEPLVITLPRGARLAVTLGPAAVARDLRRACGLPADGPAPTQRAAPELPGLRLRRGDGRAAEFVPPASAAACMVAGDGSFAFDGVPPGRWQVTLARFDVNYVSLELFETVATVDLREGETTTVALDLPDWLLGDLDGQVLANDAPLANQDIALRVRGGADGQGPVRVMQNERCLRTDGEGRFHWHGRQGFLQPALVRPVGKPKRLWDDVLRAREEVFLPAGGKVTQLFHLDSAKLRLRVLDGDGRPVAGVGLFLRGDGDCSHMTEASDAEGRISCEVEMQPFTVQTVPRSSGSTLGRVEPKRGEPAEQELKLPPAWHR